MYLAVDAGTQNSSDQTRDTVNTTVNGNTNLGTEPTFLH